MGVVTRLRGIVAGQWGSALAPSGRQKQERTRIRQLLQIPRRVALEIFGKASYKRESPKIIHTRKDQRCTILSAEQSQQTVEVLQQGTRGSAGSCRTRYNC